MGMCLFQQHSLAHFIHHCFLTELLQLREPPPAFSISIVSNLISKLSWISNPIKYFNHAVNIIVIIEANYKGVTVLWLKQKPKLFVLETFM